MLGKYWKHFSHDADLGIRGIGATKEEAFEQAAIALTAVLTDPHHGRETISYLASKGIVIRSLSMREVADEAPGAYKEVGAVVDAADHARLSRKVARLVPLICIKG